jgi:hypothetical protein
LTPPTDSSRSPKRMAIVPSGAAPVVKARRTQEPGEAAGKGKPSANAR